MYSCVLFNACVKTTIIINKLYIAAAASTIHAIYILFIVKLQIVTTGGSYIIEGGNEKQGMYIKGGYFGFREVH